RSRPLPVIRCWPATISCTRPSAISRSSAVTVIAPPTASPQPSPASARNQNGDSSRSVCEESERSTAPSEWDRSAHGPTLPTLWAHRSHIPAARVVYNRARMPRMLLAMALALTAWQPPPPAPPAQTPPDTDIFLATLSARGQAAVARAVNITHTPGYDNQPSFTPDGASLLFTSNRGATQTDIYRYDLGTGTTARVTETPESEYSPTVTPDGKHVSVIRVEADGTQRLWRFTLEGTEPELVLERVKPVGYHAWADDPTDARFL